MKIIRFKNSYATEGSKLIIETLTLSNIKDYSLNYIRQKLEISNCSIIAVNFYKKFGYNFKNNNHKPDDEGLIRLEKFKK